MHAHIGTHLIQDVNTTRESETGLWLEIRFAVGARLWGAQVALTPRTLNETTCKSYVRNNIPKNGNVITEWIRNISDGDYTVEVYVIESSGRPDEEAVPANLPEQFSFATGKMWYTMISLTIDTSTAFQSNLITYERIIPTEVTLHPSTSNQYIGILMEETRSSYVLISFNSSKNVTVREGTTYCLLVFTGSEGKISSTPLTNVYISNVTTASRMRYNAGMRYRQAMSLLH